MTAPLKAIEQALSITTSSDSKPTWGEVTAELWSIITSQLSADDEQMLLNILRHRERLSLDESAEMPHRMPPNEMLQSLAAQALGRWTGATYLAELRRLEFTTASQALRSTLRAVIRKIEANPPREPEFVAIFQEPPLVAEPEETTELFAPICQRQSGKPSSAFESLNYPVQVFGRFGNLTLSMSEHLRKVRYSEDFEFAN